MVFGPKSPALEHTVNDIINMMSLDLDSRLRKSIQLYNRKSNPSSLELKGLQWLEKQTEEEKLSVVEADNGWTGGTIS